MFPNFRCDIKLTYEVSSKELTIEMWSMSEDVEFNQKKIITLNNPTDLEITQEIVIAEFDLMLPKGMHAESHNELMKELVRVLGYNDEGEEI